MGKGVFIHVPVDQATTPKDGRVLCHRYWAVHPEKGLAFYINRGMDDPAPQCNADRAVTERLSNKFLSGHEIRLIECVFLAHAIPLAKAAQAQMPRRSRLLPTGIEEMARAQNENNNADD